MTEQDINTIQEELSAIKAKTAKDFILDGEVSRTKKARWALRHALDAFYMALEDEKRAMGLPFDDSAPAHTLESYAWPGGYPIYYLDGRDNVLCPKCATRAENDDDEALENRAHTALVNYDNETVTCDDCGKNIDAAYESEKSEEKEVTSVNSAPSADKVE